MPGGFKKKRYEGVGKAEQINKPTGNSGPGPEKFDGRKNMRGGPNFETKYGRDFEERIYRFRT